MRPKTVIIHKLIIDLTIYYTPAPPNVEWEYTGFTLMSVPPFGPIHFITGIYPYGMYGVSILTSIHFHVPSLIFGCLVAKNGVSGTFWKKLLAQLIFFLTNSHLCSTRLQNRNLYWIFLDEVGNDQNGGILSPFMGTACFVWRNWQGDIFAKTVLCSIPCVTYIAIYNSVSVAHVS